MILISRVAAAILQSLYCSHHNLQEGFILTSQLILNISLGLVLTAPDDTKTSHGTVRHVEKITEHTMPVQNTGKPITVSLRLTTPRSPRIPSFSRSL